RHTRSKRDWSSDVCSSDLSARGFRIGPSSLRTGLAEDYFARLEDVWQKHSIGMATRIINGLFPGPDEDVDAVAGAETWLAEHGELGRASRRERGPTGEGAA